MQDNKKIRQEIIGLITKKDIQDTEEYIRKISRNELALALMDRGFDKENIEQQLAVLCEDGSFALDEQNLYQYEET